MRFFLVRTVLMASALSLLQSQPLACAQESRNEATGEKRVATTDKRLLAQATTRLQQAVNGKAVVQNDCQRRGKSFKVEESTEIVEIKGCEATFKTRKRSTSADGVQQLEFTLFANLAELTTPVSVEPATSAECKSVSTPILRVASRAQPGKKVRATMQTISRPADGNQASDEKPAATTRNDVSFFFHDPAMAKRAARALDRAVKLCGGQEWPDEDDLP